MGGVGVIQAFPLGPAVWRVRRWHAGQLLRLQWRWLHAQPWVPCWCLPPHGRLPVHHTWAAPCHPHGDCAHVPGAWWLKVVAGWISWCGPGVLVVVRIIVEG